MEQLLERQHVLLEKKSQLEQAIKDASANAGGKDAWEKNGKIYLFKCKIFSQFIDSTKALDIFLAWWEPLPTTWESC